MSAPVSARLARVLSKQIFSITPTAACRLKYLINEEVSKDLTNSFNTGHRWEKLKQLSDEEQMIKVSGLKNQLNYQQSTDNSPLTTQSIDSTVLKVALKISLQRKGCNGLSYQLNFVDPQKRSPSDEIVNTHGITLIIDSKAIMFLIGTEMDFIEEPLGSRFIFKNPNQKSSCGCGKSFSI